MPPKAEFSASNSHFGVTSGQMTSLPGHFQWHEVRVVISCHLTATFCEIQPCRSINAPKTRVFGHLQLVGGHFRTDDMTSASPEVLLVSDVIYCLVTTTSCEFQPCKRQNASRTRVFGLPQLAWGHYQSDNVTSESCELTSCHVMSFPFMWLLPASYSHGGAEIHSKRKFLAFS